MSSLRDRVALLVRAWRYRFRVDRHEIRHLLAHLAPGACAVDVGAHKGAYTHWMARAVGPGGRVFAFEPQPALAHRLRQALAAAGKGQVAVENLAISDRPGKLRLRIPAGGTTCGATLEPREGPAVEFEVQVTSLDRYFEDHPGLRVGFLKVDVEGHELAVFRGAERILRTDRPELLFECEARHLGTRPIGEVFRYLEDLGYEGCFYRGGRRIPVSAFRPEMQRFPGTRSYVNNFAFSPSR